MSNNMDFIGMEEQDAKETFLRFYDKSAPAISAFQEREHYIFCPFNNVFGLDVHYTRKHQHYSITTH